MKKCAFAIGILAFLLIVGLAIFEDDPGEEPTLIDLDATALQFVEGEVPGAPSYWVVEVTKVYAGPEPCSDIINVIVSQALAPPWGFVDKYISPGEKVMINAAYFEDEDGCWISLHGSTDYSIRGESEI
ncbi:MAG: hypothetical protein WDA01_10835 [Methanothrix sp.]|jgi:hypothetical protein